MITEERPNHHMRRLLLLNRNHIGDALFTLPAIAALRAALPQTVIVNATPRALAPLFSTNRHINRVWERDSLTFGNEIRFMTRVRRAHFDGVILFPTSSTLFGIYSLLSGAGIRVGFDNPPVRPYLTHRVPVREDRHHADDTLELVRSILPVTGSFAMELPIDEEWERAWNPILNGVILHRERPVIGLNPGSTMARKCWPADRWAALARETWREGFQPVLFGGPCDREIVDQVLSLCPELPSLHNRLTLPGLAVALRHCSAFVSGDTGPMHLSVAVGTPVVALHGPTDPNRTGPYGGRSVAIHHPETPAMDAIGVQEVLGAVNRMAVPDPDTSKTQTPV